ncbi:sporulation protein YqfD [Bacillus sp. FJAT-50079]|uniref:sporulation protein YqfD n=1 Tax=Bacillus sp. FJAT-50079 TaxID=2833577 RepID=UPI001BCA2050|nr:sporulation protein YqfD [Bacillus sp. FJAT-50079]MBS4209070.1 sporulation protein YqfD [Bacillus sp. FJAT-50079]
MKNQWLTFISGRVYVRVKGPGLERFLNQLTRAKLAMWKIRRLNKHEIVFYIELSNLHTLRHIARETDCEVTLPRGEGLPFLWKRVLKNSGFAIGIMLFLFVILFLSNVTWGIHITGADPATEHKIRKELDKIGVTIGRLHFAIADPESIQQHLTETIDNLTWIGVELKGTTYHFQAVQKTEPEKVELKSPGHLVAKKKAVISKLFVEKGKPVVKVHQYVEKGELLVSGLIGSQGKEEAVAAKGEVWGLTWYNSKVDEYPLESLFQVYSGEEKRVHSIKINKFNLPIWGMKKNDFQDYGTEIDIRPIRFLGWELPISYQELTIREKEKIVRKLTKEEAIEAAKELARKSVKTKIPEDARIEKEFILHEDVENGKVNLSINFQVIENIAEEKPFIQGD